MDEPLLLSVLVEQAMKVSAHAVCVVRVVRVVCVSCGMLKL
jgi:hypothetical protein